MARTRTTPTAKLTPKYGTSSGTNPAEDFEEPEDLSDVAGIDAEIPRGSARPTGSLVQPKPKPRSPIGIEVGKSAGGGLGITVALPLGAGPISGRGGINIGKGGAIKGGSIGLGFGLGPIGGSIDVGTDQDEEGRGGCYQYLTVTVGPFSHTYGRNVCEPKPPVPPAPTPTPTPAPAPAPAPRQDLPPIPPQPLIIPPELPPVTLQPIPPSTKHCRQVVKVDYRRRNFNDFTWYQYAKPTDSYGEITDNTIIVSDNTVQYDFKTIDYNLQYAVNRNTNNTPSGNYSLPFRGYAFDPNQAPWRVPGNTSLRCWVYPVKDSNGNTFAWVLEGHEGAILEYKSRAWQRREWRMFLLDGVFARMLEIPTTLRAGDSTNLKHPSEINPKTVYRSYDKSYDTVSYELTILEDSCSVPTPVPTPTPTPPITGQAPENLPNPPPKKKMDDKCCKQSLILQAEILRLLGRELGPQGLVPQTKKIGFIGEEFERVQTPIENPVNPKKIKVRFETVYELLMYALKQSNNLDVALDPQSYKIPTGKVQNPAYSRDSEQSLKSNNQPGEDKAGNKREFEINKDDEVRIGGALQQLAYVFESQKRMEYLFPTGELSDAVIAKDLLIPGAKGDIKIHNMIMAYEIQMQYLNATFGNPREIISVKDANPAIKGDQPVEVRALSLSDLLRQSIKFQIDTGGDLDSAVNLLLRIFRTDMANRLDIVKIAEATQALFEDTGMLENQDWIEVHLEGDPYAGQWVKGQGFKPNSDLEKKTEEATEKVLMETMNPTEQKVKVSRRSKDEKTDMRDLLRGLADFIQRLLSIPSAGDAAKSIDKLVESAKFKVETDMALLRQNVSQAAAASRNRTKKRKK